MSLTACTRPSTLAKVLDDGYGLQGYVAATTLATVARHKDLRDRLAITAATADPDEWREFKPLHELAQERRGKPEAEAGTNVHRAVQALVEQGEAVAEFMPADVLADARAALAVLEDLGMRPVESEGFVVNLDGLPEPYAGTRDTLALHEPSGGAFVVVDYKTTTALGSAQYRGLSWSMQLAMYGRGLPYLGEGEVARDRYGRPLVDPDLVGAEERHILPVGLVVEVERGTGRALAHRVDLEAGWAFARLACEVRAARKAPVLL